MILLANQWYRIWIKKTSTDFIVKLDEEKDPD